MPTIDELVSAANAIKADAAKKAADENSVLRDVLTEIGTSLADIVGLLESSNDAEKAERDKPTEATLLAVELAKSLRDAMAEVRIEVQAAKSPVVTVTAPTVNVAAPTVNYTPPAINLPPTQPAAVNVMPSDWVSCTVEIDEREGGLIKRLTITKQKGGRK